MVHLNEEQHGNWLESLKDKSIEQIDPKTWVSISDDQVKVAKETDIFTSEAYMLFYERA